MSDWTYYAGSIVSLDDTLALIRRHHAMWRGVRNSKGAMIANVAHLQPGDTLHFAYRQQGQANYIFRARVGTPTSPHPEAAAVDRLGGEAGEQLHEAGYPRSDDGTVEVIRLLDVEEVAGRPAVEPPPGLNALHRGSPRFLEPPNSGDD